VLVHLAVDTRRSPFARWSPVVAQLTRGFWSDRAQVVRSAGLAHGYRMLEQAGNFLDLRLAAGTATGSYQGPVFMDSDVYKWLEAVAYFAPIDPEVRRMADQAIGHVQAAQQPDGYLNSYWHVVQPTNRWTDFAMGHELYCLGHLLQAAVAWQRFLDDDRLLRVARAAVDHVASLFGPGKRQVTPGHPEIETALVELYRLTEENRYLDLAQLFVDNRGHGLLGEAPRFGGHAYYQDRVPVREATEVEGHAVRALYLCAGVADIYLETGEAALLSALEAQWQDMVLRKLSLTGGVGSRHQGEAFGQPYELPNDRAYNETCAAIASIMWSWRMLLATGDGQYADLIERTLYNGFLSGMSLDGTRFFYVNPLASSGMPEVIGRGGHERREWYYVACCPPNVMRLIGSLGEYIASASPDGMQLHQYTPCTLSSDAAKLRVETAYPWHGSASITVKEARADAWALRLRIPSWSSSATLRINGSHLAPALEGGYAVVHRSWQQGDRLELELDMRPRLTRAHQRVDATRGSTAIERGPIVYCVEQCDHPEADILDACIDSARPLAERSGADLLDGMVTLTASGSGRPADGPLYGPLPASAPEGRRVELTAVPYFAWANRQPGAMRVWSPVR
jgi:DUF1680 family protein